MNRRGALKTIACITVLSISIFVYYGFASAADSTRPETANATLDTETQSPFPIPESQLTAELESIKKGVATMLADSADGTIMVGCGFITNDLMTIGAIGKNGNHIYLSDYVDGLNGTVADLGVRYMFWTDGTTIQIP
ncbi:MAG: hypothetical protein PHR56_01625 [Dehalococcoidales bacterium]|nr:hypothetical protein [Dehalococcoidales bacterium]